MVQPAPASESASPAAAPGNPAVPAVSALGVVYGDLGTSPLYTLQTVIGAVVAGSRSRDLEQLDAPKPVFKPDKAVYFASRSQFDARSRAI